MSQESAKHIIRRLFGPALQRFGYSVGLMRLTALPWRPEGAIILMYHTVADNRQAKWIDPDNHVPATVFARQMEFLSRQRRVISLPDLVLILQEGKTPPPGTIVITFDDGYLDNLTVAAPILDHYELPATLFLPTGYIERQENQWVDQVYSAFKFRSKPELTWEPGSTTRLDLDDPDQYRTAYGAVCGALMTVRAQERRALLNRLYKQLQPTGLPPRLTMNWDEVRSLLNRHRCFNIGGHTLEHTDLTKVSGEEARNELTACAQKIENELRVKPLHFSFCYGRTSEHLRRLTADTGFQAACGGDGLDPVIKAPADLFRLPRVAGPPSMQRFDLLTNPVNTGIWRKLGR